MGIPQRQPEQTPERYSVEAYFELEQRSDVRHEYLDGEVTAMAGTTMNHNDIVDNVRTALKNWLRPQGCRVFSESVKLEAIRHFYYPYPDVMVTCHPDDLNGSYIVRHPSLLVEVLSKSTASTDQGFKLKKYQQLPSLQYYLLVSQYECSVEVYGRTDPTIWSYQLFERLEEEIPLPRLSGSLSVAAIYADIRFRPETTDELGPTPADF